ncbi:MAG: ArsR/SmtB family transcription factor [Anaerostipes hadrus]
MSYKEDVRMIKALADENRLRILECLHHGEKCACVILEELSITQSTLSHHMKLLCDCGLVDSRKRWAMDALLNFRGREKRFKDMFSHYLGNH